MSLCAHCAPNALTMHVDSYLQSNRYRARNHISCQIPRSLLMLSKRCNATEYGWYASVHKFPHPTPASAVFILFDCVWICLRRLAFFFDSLRHVSVALCFFNHMQFIFNALLRPMIRHNALMSISIDKTRIDFRALSLCRKILSIFSAQSRRCFLAHFHKCGAFRMNDVNDSRITINEAVM